MNLSTDTLRSIWSSVGRPARQAADSLATLVSSRPTGIASVTSVADSATTVNLLAAQPTRAGAALFNDSTAIAYIKCGATASATSFTVKVAAGGYWELPFMYAGVIDCIWASAPGGFMRITEFV